MKNISSLFSSLLLVAITASCSSKASENREVAENR
jgi:hypothetical protein